MIVFMTMSRRRNQCPVATFQDHGTNGPGFALAEREREPRFSIQKSQAKTNKYNNNRKV